MAAAAHAWVGEGQRAACEGQSHIGSYPGGCLRHEQTFIHREETLAQDVAAAPKLHPEPAVRGGDGLRGFVTTEPTWEVEKNSQADSKRGLKQAKSSIPSNAAQGEQQTLLRQLTLQHTQDGRMGGTQSRDPPSGEFQTPVNQSARSITQAPPLLLVGSS